MSGLSTVASTMKNCYSRNAMNKSALVRHEVPNLMPSPSKNGNPSVPISPHMSGGDESFLSRNMQLDPTSSIE